MLMEQRVSVKERGEGLKEQFYENKEEEERGRK